MTDARDTAPFSVGVATIPRRERALVELDRALKSGRVLVDLDARQAHAQDESEAEGRLPDAVIEARSPEDVAATLRVAHAHHIPVTPRAGGTGRAGGAVPMEGGWVLSLSRFDRLLEVDAVDEVAIVEPGVVTGALHEAVEAEGLFYPPDPNSLEGCTIGGNVATNAGGPRAYRYGVTRDWILGLEVVLADGTLVTLGRRTKKGVTGYDLTSLIVGSEGTLAVVTKATCRLMPRPEAVRTGLAFFAEETAVSGAIHALTRARLRPRCLELLDEATLALLRPSSPVAIPEVARALLLFETDGDEDTATRELERAGGVLVDAGALDVIVAKHGGDREALWAVRREMSRMLRRSAKKKLSEDVVVPLSKLGALMARCRSLGEEHRVRVAAYGHAGDGNLHVNFLWDEPDERPRVDAAIEGLFRSVIDLGGTLSGEHGIGALKAPYLSLEQSPALIDLQRRIKAELDPRSILNPGKILPTGAGHHAC